MNKEIIVMIGVPGSGKSTYVNSHLQNYQIICADDIRLSLGHVFNPKIEPIVHSICETMVRAFMIRGLPIVIDETNTRLDTIQKWTNLADEYEYKKIALHINTPENICKERRGCNEGLFPEEVIDRMIASKELLLSILSIELKDLFDEFKEIKT